MSVKLVDLQTTTIVEAKAHFNADFVKQAVASYVYSLTGESIDLDLLSPIIECDDDDQDSFSFKGLSYSKIESKIEQEK